MEPVWIPFTLYICEFRAGSKCPNHPRKGVKKICRRRLRKHWIKNLHKWKYDYWIEMKIVWQKEKLVITNNFSYCTNNFKRHRLNVHQKAFACRQGFDSKSEGYTHGFSNAFIVQELTRVLCTYLKSITIITFCKLCNYKTLVSWLCNSKMFKLNIHMIL